MGGIGNTEKRIEVVRLKVKEIKNGFGNPRKIKKQKREELKDSLERNGDFGIFLIDEHNNVIAGNQRLSILAEENPEREVLCKRLIGYSTTELRAINIQDNTHAGEWDLNLLAEWTADLNLDIDIGKEEPLLDERDIEGMPPIAFKKYDYVIIACKNEIDYQYLQEKLGIDGKKVIIPCGGKAKNRKIKARAIWFDDIKAQIVAKGETGK